VLDTLKSAHQQPMADVDASGGTGFFSDGRVAVSTLAAMCGSCRIDQSLTKLHWRRFAPDFIRPVGLKIIDGQIYVLGRDQITRCTISMAMARLILRELPITQASSPSARMNVTLDLIRTAMAIFIHQGRRRRNPDRLHAHTGTMLESAQERGWKRSDRDRIAIVQWTCDWAHGELACGDNEGTWSPASRINLIQRGGILRQMERPIAHTPPTDFDQPIVWLPRSFDTSARGCSGRQGLGPLSGHLLGTSYGQSILITS